MLYSKRLLELSKKYAEAKNIVGDIIMSFNRQMKIQNDKLEISSRKLNVLFSRSESFIKRLQEQEERVQTLAEKAEAPPSVDKALIRIENLENKLKEVMSKENAVLGKIAEIEKKRSRSREREPRIESAIPIKREKALAPLTETELIALKFLAVKGDKTTPEIREQIGLSREHTARLMKKLYEDGYLERRTNKIPFIYHLKDEMQKILKKPEQKS